jgi:hypothetical protein
MPLYIYVLTDYEFKGYFEQQKLANLALSRTERSWRWPLIANQTLQSTINNPLKISQSDHNVSRVVVGHGERATTRCFGRLQTLAFLFTVILLERCKNAFYNEDVLAQFCSKPWPKQFARHLCHSDGHQYRCNSQTLPSGQEQLCQRGHKFTGLTACKYRDAVVDQTPCTVRSPTSSYKKGV